MCVGLCAVCNVGVMQEWLVIHRIRGIFLYIIPWVPCFPVCRRNIHESTAFYSLVALATVECVFCGMRAETEETVEHEDIIHRNTAGWQHSYRWERVIFFQNKGTTDKGSCRKLCADNNRAQWNRIVITAWHYPIKPSSIWHERLVFSKHKETTDEGDVEKLLGIILKCSCRQ